MSGNKSVMGRVREAFIARRGEVLSYADVFAAIGLVNGDRSSKNTAREGVKYLVERKFVEKIGEGKGVCFRFNGVPEVEQPVRKGVQKLSRINLQASNIPTRAAGSAIKHGGAETVEQYLARGGKVERLTAFWEQAA